MRLIGIRLGTRYFESGKFQGFKNERPMLVIEYEQERLPTLATSVEVSPAFRERYRIEPLSAGICRVQFTTEIGGVPIAPEFFMGQSTAKEQP